MSERRDDDAPDRDDLPEGSDADAPEGPEPATWAGRQAWKGLPDESEDPGEEGEAPEEADPAADEADGPRLTEEFDEVEREFADDLAGDEGLDDEEESDDEASDDEASDDEASDDEASEDEASEDEEDIDEDVEGEDGEEAAIGAAAGAEHTIEADTPALADQEEAREAALAGLRARTAEHAAKRGITDPGVGAAGAASGPETPAAGGEPADDEQGEAADEAAGAQPEPATAVAAAAGAAQPPSADAVPADQQKPPGRGLWARFLTASFLIVVSMATATSVSLLVYLTDIAKGLGGLEGLSGQLDALDEKAQNFLVLGSDVRPDEPGHGRSDTTMLLRIDPDKHLISQLSIPRDLEVSIPHHGVDKFNAAYSYGGPKLTLQTIKQLTGDRIDINHVVNVDFNGFADAVDAIDCVYMDIDHHYFHSNEGVGFTDQYAEIDIEAGYQRLCGLKALQYVRYRHEDNDLVRAARQQAFLREARQKVPPKTLLDDRDELIDIFAKYTTSDISDAATLVQLFKLMLDARNAQINQVQFPFDSLDNEGYVTYSAAPLQAAIDEFLGEGVPEPSPEPANPGGGGDEGGKPSGDKPESKPNPNPNPAPAPAADLIDSTGVGQQYSTVLAQAAGKEIKFPILYPTRLAPGSTVSDTDTRWFRIDGPGNDIYRGYKFVVSMPGTSYPTAYYGVSGTDWLNAPLFANPSEQREINGRTYKLYYDAGRLRMVAFQRDKAMYWVTNTLDNLVTNEQMLGIAQNLAVPGG